MTENSINPKVAADPFENDLHRPQYHFLPPANWMNDPNGLIRWKGQYHLFYQHNPVSPTHGNIHWGHAISRDAIHWTHLPLALSPDPDGPDAGGCWSGCAVDANGELVLFYTGINPQVVCMAIGTDDALTFRKHPGNPIISGPPSTVQTGAQKDFRDPFVWREADCWYMLVGSQIEQVGGIVLLYSSRDLVNWEYMGPLYQGDRRAHMPFWDGVMWECPNLIELDSKHHLLISISDDKPDAVGNHLLYAAAYSGVISERRFTPVHKALLDYGDCFYAPQILQDDNDRTMMWGWLRERRSVQQQVLAGWSGVMSLPRVLISGAERLESQPAPELRLLRDEHVCEPDIEFTPRNEVTFETPCGCTWELIADFEFMPGARLQLTIEHTRNGTDRTLIIYDSGSETLNADTTHSSRSPDVYGHRSSVRVHLNDQHLLHLHLYVDRSVLELFTNGGIALSKRIYPSGIDGRILRLEAEGNSVRARSIDVWSVRSIW